MSTVRYPAGTFRTWRMPRATYDRMIETGILGEDDPIELLDGRLIVAEPKHSPHETSVRLVAEALRPAFGEGWVISVGAPLALGGYSEPEPDVSVVRGAVRDYRNAHPTGAALVVEVADSSLRFDRRIKAPIYAAAGIADYWLVNLVDRVVEVYREPIATKRRRSAYGRTTTFGVDDAIAPLAAAHARIAVRDLLP